MKFPGLCELNRGSNDDVTIKETAIRRGASCARRTMTPTTIPVAVRSSRAGKTNSGINHVSPPVLAIVIHAAVAKIAAPAAQRPTATPALRAGIRRPAPMNNPIAAATRKATEASPHGASDCPVPGSGRELQASPMQPPGDTNRTHRPAPPRTQHKPVIRGTVVSLIALSVRIDAKTHPASRPGPRRQRWGTTAQNVEQTPHRRRRGGPSWVTLAGVAPMFKPVPTVEPCREAHMG